MSTAITEKYLRRKIRELKKSAANHRGDIRPGKRRFGLYRCCQTKPRDHGIAIRAQSFTPKGVTYGGINQMTKKMLVDQLIRRPEFREF